MWLSLDRPDRVDLSWQWLGPERHIFLTDKVLLDRLLTGGEVPRSVPLLDKPATLGVRFIDLSATLAGAATRLRLSHGGVPIEWVSDLVEFWKSRCDIWAYQVRQPDKYWRGR